MTPIVDHRVLHFEFAGLYDGVSILRDRETRSLWHHVTGVCLYGPLKGRQLPSAGNLLHTTVREALAEEPDVRLALSDRPVRQPSRWAPLAERVPVLGPVFLRTMSREDTRRPTMDVGLGVWMDSTARYYPLETIRAAGNAIVDTVAGRNLVVYFSTRAGAPGAIFTSSPTARWGGDTLRFAGGAFLSAGVFYDGTGRRLRPERPMQLFTRWYGYALMFPGTTIYERPLRDP